MRFINSFITALFTLFLTTTLLNAGTTVTLSDAERDWMQQNPITHLGGGPDWAPFDFIDSNNQYTGISYDYLTLVEKYTGLQFKVSIDSWKNSLKKIKDSKIDVIGAAYFTEERTQYVHFSKPYFEVLDYFFIRDDLNVKTLEDLNGKRVAVPDGYAQRQVLKEHFPLINIVTVTTFGEAIDAVLENKADMLFDAYATISHTLKSEGIGTIIPFKSTRHLGVNEIHVITRKNAPLLASIIQKGLNAISADEKQAIQRKWLGIASTSKFNHDSLSTNSSPVSSSSLPKSQKIPLSDEEQLWLDNHKNIRFTGNPNWLPLEAFNKQGEHIGIAAEHLTLIEQKLGITLTKIVTKSWADSVAKIKAGESDILSESTSSELHSFLYFTQPYISNPVVIVMNNNHQYIENIEQIKHKKIALIKDYAYADEIIEQYPNIQFTLLNDIQEGLIAVSSGQVDVLFATLAQSSYHIANLGLSNVIIVGKTEFTSKQAFSIRSELAPLVPLFNRAIQAIDQEEKQKILDRWGASRFAVKTNYQLVFQIAAVLALIIMVFVYWNRKLAKEVGLRAKIERQTQSIIDAIPIQIIITSPKGDIISANPQTLKDYKIHKDEMTQYKMSEFYAEPSDRKMIIDELTSKGKIDQKLIKFKRLDDEIRSMMVSIMPVTFNNKAAFLSIAVDLTERLEMEKALFEAKESAESANKAKSTFLANMSHEIRTPMNAIIGFTELLNDQIHDSKLKKFTQIIQSAGNNLLSLINDILDLSKIESGRFNIEKTACNLHDLFTEISNIFMMKMQENNIDFVIDFDPNIPKSLLLDATRLRQVIFNLIGNAVKFTHSGHIKVIVRAINKDAICSKVDLIISIEDSGIGIAQDQLSSIFKEFEQAKGQDNSRYGGTGLGLPISLRLIEMMGGELHVESEPNKGSTFNILLKQVDVASVDQVDIHSDPLKDIHFDFLQASILVVDDVADNRALIIENLSMFPALTVLQAHNGEEAVNLARNKDLDLILMDIRMPVMDGYQATHQIRSFSNIPIIALTASVVVGEFKPLQQDDFDGYLRKPILKKDLFKELSLHLPFKEVPQHKQSSSDIVVNSMELTHLNDCLKQLKPLQEQCVNAMQDNDILSITQFANDVLTIAKQHPIKVVQVYATTLLTNIDSFDISSIQNNLENFSTLISSLEKIAHKHS